MSERWNLSKLSDSPKPWGRRVRKPCRAAAEAGSPGGGIPQGGAAWCPLGPGSGQCSPVELLEAPLGHTGIEFLGDIPLNPGEGEEEGSWAGCPVQEACWGAGARWGPAGQADTEVAAWSDGQSHRALSEEEGGKRRKGRWAIRNRRGRGRTVKEIDARVRACYLTRALLHVCSDAGCNTSYLAAEEEGKTQLHGPQLLSKTLKSSLTFTTCAG